MFMYMYIHVCNSEKGRLTHTILGTGIESYATNNIVKMVNRAGDAYYIKKNNWKVHVPGQKTLVHKFM